MAFFIGLMFGGGGLLLAYDAGKPISDFLRSGDWERVEGEVLESVVEEEDNSAVEKVWYRYQFRGESFEGERLRFGGGPTNIGKQKMAETVRLFSKGKVIEMWVNPSVPDQSVIFRELSYQVWLSVCGSVPFLLVGVCAAIYAFFGGRIWAWSHRLKCEIGVGAPEEIREALEAEEIREGQELLFTDQVKKSEGITVCAAVVFGGSIVMLLVIGMVVMLRSGDALGYFMVLLLLPLFFLVPRLLAYLKEVFFRNEIPAWVFLADGVCLGESGREGGEVSLQWMPCDAEASSSVKRCQIGLARWKSAHSLKKWRAQNPDWKKDLQEIQGGEAGRRVFQLDRLVEKSRFRSSTYDLYLLLVWQREDGVEAECDFALKLNGRD